MENIELDRLIYLVVLGTAIAGWFIAENRSNLSKTLRQGLVWGLIFLGMIAGFGLWDDIRSEVSTRQAVLENGNLIEVPRARDGHFHLSLDVNGEKIDFLVDTGATDIVLSRDDAEAIGLRLEDLAFIGTAQTANGEVRTAYTSVDEVALGPLKFENVTVAVNSGDMRGSLLGMAYLSRFEKIELSGDEMRLYP